MFRFEVNPLCAALTLPFLFLSTRKSLSLTLKFETFKIKLSLLRQLQGYYEERFFLELNRLLTLEKYLRDWEFVLSNILCLLLVILVEDLQFQF